MEISSKGHTEVKNMASQLGSSYLKQKKYRFFTEELCIKYQNEQP